MNVFDKLAEIPKEYAHKAAIAQGYLKSNDPFQVDQGIRTLDGLAANAAMVGSGNSTPPSLGDVTCADRAQFTRAADYLRGMADHGRTRITELRSKPGSR